MRKKRLCTWFSLPALGSITALGCSSDVAGTKALETRDTSLGESVYGVLCDRLGAQTLTDDLSGASFRNVCRRDPQSGAFADKVDTKRLPPLRGEALDREGRPVPLDRQERDRGAQLARIEALARHRTDLIASLNALFPENKDIATLRGLGPLRCTNGLKFLETPSFEGVATNGSVEGASPFMGWGP